MPQEHSIEVQESEWDKKRIILGVFALVIVLGGALYGAKVLGLTETPDSQSTKSVAAAETQATQTVSHVSTGDIKQTIDTQIASLQQQVQQLSPQDLASSSPQVQKIMQDIKALQAYPHDQAKQYCLSLCNGL